MIRKARINEVMSIYHLLSDKESHGIIPRSLAYLYAHIRDYTVYDYDDEIWAVGALHVCWDGWGEIRSLAVVPNRQKEGLGRAIMRRCIHEARALELNRVFILTLIPEYFATSGFKEVGRADLPPIAWADCVNCIKFPHCNEIPMVKQL